MAFIFRRSTGSETAEDFASLLRRAQGGDKEAREKLIADYTPFVLRVASSACGRYLRIGVDEESSIGLMAFNEAIDNYRFDKSAGFLSFCETVIRRRLIDYYRKQTQHREVPLSSLETEDEEGNTTNIPEERASLAAHADAAEIWERQEEIKEFARKLNEQGITFQELVRVSPKHEDARKRAIQAAKLIASNSEYRAYFLEKGELPLKSLEREVDLSRKTLERHRKYIIALTIILIEDFSYLREYLEK